MRRVGGLWPMITSFDNLQRAAMRASLGKRRQDGIARFLIEREPLLLTLQRELVDESYEPGPMSSFAIYDPKPRTIRVAPFRDRVVHHAIIDVLEPWLDRRLIHSTFACRRGKGTHAAIEHAQALVRRHAWFLVMDVERFFASIRHDLVMTTMARIVKDAALLRLIARVLAAGGRAAGTPDVGLPVGNLTSQWFANLSLRTLDTALVEHERVAGQVRYMDDFVCFGDRSDTLCELRARIEARLATLALRAKPSATRIGRSRDGLSFLGFVIFPALRRIRPANRRRVIRRWKQRLGQWQRGEIDEAALADAVRASLAHLEHGTTRGFRRRWCAVLDRRGPN